MNDQPPVSWTPISPEDWHATPDRVRDWVEALLAGERPLQTNALRDRDRVEAALKTREEQLRLALDFTQTGSWDWDLLTNQLTWNRIHFQLLGLDPDQTQSSYDQWRDRLHPDDLEAVEATISMALKTRTPYRAEYRIIHPDGNIRWMLGKGKAVYDEAGLPIRMVGVLLDITERKQSEAALHQREQEFRALVENAPDIIIRFDHTLHYLYINPAIQAVTGLSPQALVGKTHEDLGLSSAQIAVWNTQLSQVFEQGEQRVLEFELPTPQGLKCYQARCVPEFAPDGSVASVLSLSHDITERKHLETALRQQIERSEAMGAIAQQIRQSLKLSEILHTTVVEVKHLLKVERVVVYQFRPDMAGTIVAESVTAGWPIALGTHIHDTCFQANAGIDYRQGKRCVIADVAEAGLSDCHRQLLEQFAVRANVVVPILLQEDSRARLWGLLIVHQCKGPRQWHPTQVELLDRIAVQLAIAIQQAQTFEQAQLELLERQQAEAHLRTALSEKEVLLKEIHHRVKNNLQIVSGLLQLQAQGFTNPSIINALRESQSRVESMSLIHKKLYTSSDLGQIDVADYIHSLAVSLLTTYQISPGTIALQVDVEPVSLSLDQAIPCGLIINELVSNALKYAFPDQRPGEIHITLHQHHGNLELTIKDNGVGLPDHLDWQKTPSLGLSLVSALATDQLDGHFTVERHPGTAFHIQFPMLHFSSRG